jgi:hypothetical protein
LPFLADGSLWGLFIDSSGRRTHNFARIQN